MSSDNQPDKIHNNFYQDLMSDTETQIETPAPPTIRRKKNDEEESLFHESLARAYNCNVSDITIEHESIYKIYKLNGHVIFRDRI